MVSSTVPRFDERWPPVCETLCTTYSRNSPASCFSSRRESLRRSAGEAMEASSLPGMSAVPVDDTIGERVQALHVVEAARLERDARRMPQGVGALPRRLEAEDADVGRLVGIEILAGGLAEGRRCLRHVEDVIDDLERQADRLAVARQRLPLQRRGLAASGAHQHA